jgi:hypothetical protein
MLDVFSRGAQCIYVVWVEGGPGSGPKLSIYYTTTPRHDSCVYILEKGTEMNCFQVECVQVKF